MTLRTRISLVCAVVALAGLYLTLPARAGSEATPGSFRIPTGGRGTCDITFANVDALPTVNGLVDCVDETEEGLITTGVDAAGIAWATLPDMGDGCAPHPDAPYKSARGIVSGSSTFRCGNSKKVIVSTAYVEVKIGGSWEIAGDGVGRHKQNASEVDSGQADAGCRAGGNRGKLYRVVGDGGFIDADGHGHNFKPKPGDPQRFPCPLEAPVGVDGK